MDFLEFRCITSSF